MSDFVQVFPPRLFSRLREELEELRANVLTETAPILRRAEEASIRQRFYRTGKGLRALKEETVTEGQKKSYRLFPTAFYMIFGEFGTGRRGARTGGPAPRGYTYGKKEKGSMEARRYSRIAVADVRPRIIETAASVARTFARNVTVS